MDDAGVTEATGQTADGRVYGIGEFWQGTTLAELAASQGVSLTPDYDALVGRARELWAGDAEFEAFLADLRTSRREGA